MIIIRLASADKWLGNRHTLSLSLPSDAFPVGSLFVSQTRFQSQARKNLCLPNATTGCTRSHLFPLRIFLQVPQVPLPIPLTAQPPAFL